jgi:hypothetical protein
VSYLGVLGTISGHADGTHQVATKPHKMGTGGTEPHNVATGHKEAVLVVAFSRRPRQLASRSR